VRTYSSEIRCIRVSSNPHFPTVPNGFRVIGCMSSRSIYVYIHSIVAISSSLQAFLSFVVRVAPKFLLQSKCA
jgi:hypothetical protein